VTAWFAIAGVVLLLANAFFVAAEFALVAARRTRLEQLAELGEERAALALRSAGELSLMLAGAQLGITMASLGLGYVAEPAVGRVVEAALGVAQLPAGVEHSVAVVIALGIVVFLHMVVGEMAPKNLAIAQPERAAMLLARPMRAYVTFFGPVIRLLNATANAFLALFKVPPTDELVTGHTPDELRALLSTARREGVVDEAEHRLLTGALGFSDRTVASVMVPRTRVVAIPAEATPDDLQRIVNESGHSRLPVYGRDVDDVLGFVHSKSLLEIPEWGWDRPIPARLVRQMLVVAEAQRLPDVLVEMQRAGIHFAVVVDGSGATRGIVTLEDVLEALVGDIRDEYDRSG
jgi:CBS domain containing-hemolysin-like protein